MLHNDVPIIRDAGTSSFTFRNVYSTVSHKDSSNPEWIPGKSVSYNMLIILRMQQVSEGFETCGYFFLMPGEVTQNRI